MCFAFLHARGRRAEHLWSAHAAAGAPGAAAAAAAAAARNAAKTLGDYVLLPHGGAAGAWAAPPPAAVALRASRRGGDGAGTSAAATAASATAAGRLGLHAPAVTAARAPDARAGPGALSALRRAWNSSADKRERPGGSPPGAAFRASAINGSSAAVSAAAASLLADGAYIAAAHDSPVRARAGAAGKPTTPPARLTRAAMSAALS
jgi:hypothetical protein